jgi:hypothetical protein
MLGKLLVILILFMLLQYDYNILSMNHLKLEHFDEKDLYSYKMGYRDSLRYW